MTFRTAIPKDKPEKTYGQIREAYEKRLQKHRAKRLQEAKKRLKALKLPRRTPNLINPWILQPESE